jgi:hypothetical protein
MRAAPSAMFGERRKKPVALSSEAGFEFLRTITVAAGPRFLTVQVATISTSVCILHAQEVEILLPIRPLLGQWLPAETDFHPGDRVMGVYPCLFHIPEIFISGNRPLAQCLVMDGASERCLSPGLDASFYQVTHCS